MPTPEIARSRAAGGSLGRYKWELVLLMFFAQFLNQGDRQIYNAVLPLLKVDLGLSDVQLGLVVTAFTIVFSVCVPFAGYCGDFISRKWVVFTSLMVFSLGTLCTGFSSGLIMLILFRSFATGVGEAFYFPAANALIGQYHTSTRAMAMSCHQTSQYVGVVASSWVAGWLGQEYGWRAAFYFFGSLGLLLAVVIAVRVRNERRDAVLHPAVPRQPVAAPETPVRPGEVLRGVLRVPTMYLLSAAYGGMVFVFIGYMTWMPTFLHEKFSLSVKSAAVNAVLAHFIFAFLGVLIGGRLSDHFAPRRPAIRLEMSGLGLLLGVPFIACLGFADTMTGVTIAMAGFGLCRGFFDSNLFAIPFEVVRGRYISSATGLMICCAFFIGSTSPMILGYMKQQVNLGLGISALALMYFLGGVCLFVARFRFFAQDRAKAQDGSAPVGEPVPLH